jgi:hypothetical protein
MTGLKKYNSVWLVHFTGQRGKKQKSDYENILFSIWKHHPDKDEEGFQINPKKVKGTNSRTVYRAIKLAENAGLLKKVKNYSVGRFHRFYRKNKMLFELVYRNSENKYGKWLNDNRKQDVFGGQTLSKITKSGFLELTNLNGKVKIGNADKAKRKKKKLKYDLDKLHQLSKTMLPRYYEIIVKLNQSAVHNDLRFRTFLRFDECHLPTGRPYSYFCNTRNDKKKDKVKDWSIENRSDFFERVDLGGYREVWDISSEVPRVNYLFHTGEWKPNNYDFYAEIIKDACVTDIDGRKLSRGGSRVTNYNDSMKQMFMRIYFGTGSDLQSYNGYNKERIKRATNEDWSISDVLDRDEKLPVYEDWVKICNSTRKIVKPSIGNLIFWYTFFIEAEVLLEMRNRGKAVYNVYDGFYYDKDVGREIQRLVREKALFVYENFMKGIRLED